MADLMSLKAGRTIWSHWSQRYFSLMKKEHLLKTYRS